MIAASKVRNRAIQHTHMYVFLGAFATLREMTDSSCMSVCLYVRGSHWMDFP